MSWIDIISYEESNAKLKKLYNRIKGPEDNVDNIMLVHGLRPHTMIGHMTLYKNVLHHSQNTIPKWFLETIGVYVSHLNSCDYCVLHHLSGLKKLLGNNQKFKNIELNLRSDLFFEIFDNKYRKALNYSKLLTMKNEDDKPTFHCFTLNANPDEIPEWQTNRKQRLIRKLYAHREGLYKRQQAAIK